MSRHSDRVVAWLAMLLLAFALASLHQLARASAAHDFYQFWSLARFAADHPDADLYAKETARAATRAAATRIQKSGSALGPRAAARNRALYASGVEPISTPFYYAIFVAATSEDFDRDRMRFQTVSLLGLALAVFFGCRALGYSRAGAALALGVVSIVYGPLHADIQTGNVNRLQLAGLAVALALRWRFPGRSATVAATALLAAAIAFKPNLMGVGICLVAVWIVDRRWNDLVAAAIGVGLGTLTAVGATAVLLDAGGAWADWLAALSRYGSEAAGIDQTNWSTARLLYERFGGAPSLWLGPALLASLVVAAGRGRPREPRPVPNRRREAAAIAAGLMTPLIASPVAWDHYFVLAIPACLLLLRPNPASTVASAVAVFALFVCGRGPLEAITPLEPVTLVTWIAFATLALWIALLAQLAGRADQSSA